MANLATTGFSDLITTLYEQRALTAASPRLVHARWAREAQYTGHNTYQLYRYSELSAVTTPLSEGNTPAETAAPTLSTVTITPKPYGAWLGYTQDLNLQTFSPVVSQVSQIMGRQAGLSVDTLVRTALHAGATVDYSGSAAARNEVTAVVTYNDIVEQVAALQTQNAMPVEGGTFVVVCHPQAIAVLFKDTDFKTVFTREGSGAIRNGLVGRLFNVDFYVTSNANVYVGAGASSKDVYTMLFIAAEAYGMAGFSGFMPSMGGFEGSGEYDNMTGKSASPISIITRALGETGFDPLKQRGTIGWLLYEEEAILNSAWLRSFEHAIV